jgi:ABC-type phosphate transport system permease subunit
MKAIYKSLIHILIASLILVPFSLNAAMISTDKAFKTEQSV